MNRIQFRNFHAVLIIIIGSLLIGFIIFSLNKNTENLQRNALLELGRSYNETFTGVRRFYQKSVISRIQGTGTLAVHNYSEVDGAIPIPATFMLSLSDYLNQNESEVIFSLVSDYPFPWRADRPLLPFDENALTALRSTGETEYYQISEEDGKKFLHYAAPVILEQGCVDCHNSHPESPKTDWQVGDVRAVQVFQIPFNKSTGIFTIESALVISSVLVIGITALSILVFLNNKSSAAQKQMMYEARFDSLTGAMRRPFFHEIYNRQDRDKDYFIGLLDIDNFKSYNTNFGHSSGDEILAKVSNFLMESIPNLEVFCRYGGEEFLFLVPNAYLTGCPDTFFSNIVKSVSELEVKHGENSSRVTVSLGFLELKRTDSLTLISERADAALRYAKRVGKNRSVYANVDLLKSLGYLDRAYTTDELSIALQKQELYYAFQPIVEIKSGKFVGLEALIRWRHGDGTIVPPSSFLPQFIACLRDRKNLEIVKSMLAESISNAQKRFGQISNIAFNFDPYDLINGFDENCLTIALKNLLLEGFVIGIEITETSFIKDITPSEFSAKLSDIIEMGFDVHMDDFGKEGSGLERLASQCFTRVKTDLSLVLDLENSLTKKKLLSMVVDLTKSLNVSLVVEGVETEEQRKILEELGVDLAQGYLFGRPE